MVVVLMMIRHITARLTALRKYIREVGDLPVNITFMMEGAEESASTDLEKYLEKYRDDLLPADPIGLGARKPK